MADVRRSEAVAAYLARHYRAILVGIVGLGIVLRIAVHLDLRWNDPAFDSPSLDSQAFLEWARDIASGNWMGTKVFFLNPLYPYFLAPFVLLGGPKPLLAIRVVQMLLGLATVPLVAGATRRFLGEGIALGSALLMAAWPLGLFYEQTVMIVTLANFLNALALYLLARIPERPTLRRAFVAGLPLGLAVLARPNVGLFAVLLPLWLLQVGPAGGRIRFAATRTAVLAAGAFLMVLPCTVRNWIVGRDLVLVTSSGGVNIYVSNNSRAREIERMSSLELRSNPNLIETDAIVFAERTLGRSLKPSEVSKFYSRRAMEEFEKAPWATLGFAGKKLLMFFRDFEIPSSYHYMSVREETSFLRWIPLRWGLLSPLALLGLGVALLRRRAAVPFVMLYLAYSLGLAAFFPLAHYRAPVLPGAIPLGALGLAAVAAPLLDARWRAAAGFAPGLILVTALAFPDLFTRMVGVQVFGGVPDDRVVFLYNRGMVLISRGETEAAEGVFRQAAGKDPTSWLPHMGLAMVARVRLEPANERRHLEDALRLRPSDPGARIQYARNLFETGHQQDAIRIAKEAVADAPLDGMALTGLASMYALIGRLQDAYDLLVRAEDSGLDRAMAIVDQCRCLLAMNRGQEAIENAERGLRVAPANGHLHYARALALMQTGAPRDAIAAAARAGAASGIPPPPALEPFLKGD